MSGVHFGRSQFDAFLSSRLKPLASMRSVQGPTHRKSKTASPIGTCGPVGSRAGALVDQQDSGAAVDSSGAIGDDGVKRCSCPLRLDRGGESRET